MLQVWHNYSFDRHVMERLGLRMAGFGGDTMHMARLWDSSRMTRGGYSLQALSGQCCWCWW
jgi:DNA polymerase-1